MMLGIAQINVKWFEAYTCIVLVLNPLRSGHWEIRSPNNETTPFANKRLFSEKIQQTSAFDVYLVSSLIARDYLVWGASIRN